MLFFHTFRYIVLMKYLSLNLMFTVLNAFLGNVLLGLQISKSLGVCGCAGIVVAYPLPLMLPAPFNNNLFIVIGW